jgi:peptide/nickel transport system substrate-binding protein
VDLETLTGDDHGVTASSAISIIEVLGISPGRSEVSMMSSCPAASSPPPTIPFAALARAGLALAPLLLAGCGEDASDARALRGMPAFCQEVLPAVDAWLAGFELPAGDRYGGTAVVGAIGEIADGMNGLVSSDYTANQHQIFVNLMTLVRLDENFEIAPYLAESWSFSDEGTELTFRLREGIHWHDGTPTTAHDVAFTYQRAVDPVTAFPNAAFWTHYDRSDAGVRVVDDHTVVFRLDPHAEPLDPWRAVPIMPRHLLGDVPPAELRQHPYGTRCPVGNGPFVFAEHRQDESWTFVRNPGFPETLGGPPFLDRYVYRVVPEQTTLLTELLTENLDYYVAPGPDQVPAILAEERLELRDFPFRQYVFVGWNARRTQLADARVRRALTLGTNRDQAIEALLRGYGTVANAGVPPFHYAYHEGIVDSLRYDPDRARALLDEAGWSDLDSDGIRLNAAGERLEISIKYNQGNQQRQDVAEIMQSQLREIGVAVRPQVVEWATLLDQINTPELRDFDGVVIGWVTEFKVDDRDLFHSSRLDTPFAWAGTRNPDLDVLLDTLQRVVDREEALPLWRAYQYEIVKEQPYTFLYYPQRLAGLNRRLQDVELDARGEWVNIGEWWIPAAERGRR